MIKNPNKKLKFETITKKLDRTYEYFASEVCNIIIKYLNKSGAKTLMGLKIGPVNIKRDPQ